jgi:hypothetical protein
MHQENGIPSILNSEIVLPCLSPKTVRMGEQLDALGGGNVRIGKLELFVRVRSAAVGGDECMHDVGKGADGKADVLRLR